MIPSKLKIACFVPPHYDYLASTLVEGLMGLGHICAGLEEANYIEKLNKTKFKFFLKSCDLIIIFQGGSVNCKFLDGTGSTVKVFVDGSDLPSISEMPDVTFNYVFKRELLAVINLNHSQIMYPLQFGIETRYQKVQKTEFKWSISFVGSMSNFQRLAVQEYLKSLNDPSIFTGTTGERAYNGSAGLPLPTPKYFDLLNNSFASIDIPGLGWDCGRKREILGSGALLIQFRSELIYSTRLIENEHFIGFSSLDELNKIILNIRNDLSHYNKIRKDGYKFALKHHSSKARAIYFLDVIDNETPSNTKGTKQYRRKLFQNYRKKIYLGQNYIVDKIRSRFNRWHQSQV